MLTPVDVQNKAFKGGIGFDKKDVEAFMNELSSDYEMLYRSNVELKDKVATLNESLQHYRSIEDSMQKALTLSEKTAEETVNAANDKARQINLEAEKKAETLVADAKEELINTKNDIYKLQKQHEKFKAQFIKVLNSQLKILNGEMISIDLGDDFEPAYSEGGFGGFSGESTLGGGLGGLGGGGYTGDSSLGDGFERSNQDPAINRSSLNMDPFGDAMSGGGRFSKQTGGSYTSNSKNKKTTSSKSEGKSSFNVKEANGGQPKVRKNFANTQSTSTPQESVQDEKIETSPQNNTSSNSNVKSTATANTTFKQTAVPPEATQRVDVDAVKAQAGTTTVTPEKQKLATAETQQNDVETKEAFNEEQIAGEVEDKLNESTLLGNEDDYSEGFDFVEEDDGTISGEVEDKFAESNMLESEDNYSEGFDFINDDDESSYNTHLSGGEDGTYVGEVEDKFAESNMLESEDNYSEGFDFVDADENVMPFTSTTDSEIKEDTYVGEVEDKFAESNMLESEDNYSEGFDFVVGNEEEEDDIPTIFPTTSNVFESDAAATDEDVFVGDVEDKAPQPSNLIGNADDEEEGFSFV